MLAPREGLYCGGLKKLKSLNFFSKLNKCYIMAHTIDVIMYEKTLVAHVDMDLMAGES